jgi:predicted SnoaL-like aldol condensation-catalyzing enzyme
VKSDSLPSRPEPLPLATIVSRAWSELVFDFDEQQHRAAYEAMAKGDTEPLGALMADDYVQHLTAWGFTVHGRERNLELVSRIFDRFGITEYRLDRVEQHGDFVISFISSRSPLRPEEVQGVDVVRIGPDGLAVEGWVHRPPPPEGVDVRQILDWQD